jgi:Ni/Fe-hydrogenase subunit HybB-like protein
LENDLLASLGKPAAIVLAIYLVLKVVDLGLRGMLPRLLTVSFSSVLIWLELLVGVALPLVLFANKAARENPKTRFRAAVIVVAGVLLNRMNMAVFGFYDYTSAYGVTYWPSIGEWTITLAIVTAGVAAYAAIVKFFPVLPTEHVAVHPALQVQPATRELSPQHIVAE